MSEIDVSPGQRVSAGSTLGITGLTGLTTGHHLHFEIRYNNGPVNPALYLPF
jgi:murein DD-endopeptidase MepM/ murein hydrolase activator NlpD